MRRVAVVGNSGSGKSTLARALAQRLGVPHIELDSIFHQPDWQELETEEFRSRVRAATAIGGWVVDGNYQTRLGDVVLSRADTVVWLDLPRATVMRQIIGRTLRRVIRRQELWNGNRERWSNLYSRDPYESIIMWAWTRHAPYRQQYTQLMNDPAWQHLTVIRIRSRRDAARLLATTEPAP